MKIERTTDLAQLAAQFNDGMDADDSRQIDDCGAEALLHVLRDHGHRDTNELTAREWLLAIDAMHDLIASQTY